MSAQGLPRRELLLGAGALAAAPLLARTATARAQTEADDRAFLESAIRLELINAAAYDRATARLGGIARLFRNQEREHALVLSGELRRMGGTPPTADLSSLGRAPTTPQLIRLENAAVKAYVEAHKTIRDARLMETVGSILANQAQHLVALRDLGGQDPVPTAFETGES
jgi:hypothetical protein